MLASKLLARFFLKLSKGVRSYDTAQTILKKLLFLFFLSNGSFNWIMESSVFFML